ncbi:hypothetical protein COLO4_27245 [Corchorus olitorius]|uniref:RNase H type-1 domain-containing protein n=1 Tax=Corchorus olitorius TaxID=93759 RepID=A0A1R3HRY2_9ROSI|nr:hypothetical protein COLO4_27245 [Corchorus olitorius]
MASSRIGMDEHSKRLNDIGRRVLADEALAIKDGCKLAKEQGYEKIVVESDSVAVICDINRNDGRYAWKISIIIGDIKEFLKSFKKVRLSLVKCEVNSAADWVAKQ